jgi:hypothetical protein
VEASRAWERITALVGRIVLREKTILETQAERIEAGARSVIKRVEAEEHAFVRLIQSTISGQIREAGTAVDTQHERLIDGAKRTLSDAEVGIISQTESIAQRAQLLVNTERSKIALQAHAIAVKAQGGLDAAWRELDQLKAQIRSARCEGSRRPRSGPLIDGERDHLDHRRRQKRNRELRQDYGGPGSTVHPSEGLRHRA